MKASHLAIAALLTCAITCQAGSIETGRLRGVPLIEIDKGSVRSCGIRVIAFPTEAAGRAWVPALDASYTVWAAGHGAVKAGVMKVAIKNGTPQADAPVIPMESFWIMAAGGGPTKPYSDKILDTEPKNFRLYGVSMLQALELMDATWQGREISIGFRLKGEATDRVIAGKVILTDDERARGPECLAQLQKTMEAADEAESAKPRQP